MAFRAEAPDFTPARPQPSTSIMSTMSSSTPIKQSPWNSEQIKASFEKVDSTTESTGTTPRRQLFPEMNTKTTTWSDSYDIFYHGNPARTDSPMAQLPATMEELNLGDEQHYQHSHSRKNSAWSTTGSERSDGTVLDHKWNNSHYQPCHVLNKSVLSIAGSERSDGTVPAHKWRGLNTSSSNAPFQNRGRQAISTDLANFDNSYRFPNSLDPSPVRAPLPELATGGLSEQEYKKQLVAFIKAGGLEQNNNNSPPGKRDVAPSTTAHSAASSDSGVGFGSKIPDLHNYEARNHSDVTMTYLRSIDYPAWSDLVDGLPFIDKTRFEQPHTHGVIKFTNIAYNVIQPEVVAALGEKARIVAMPRDTGTYAIHIMFDRNSAKSGDCFVELETESDALAFMARVRCNGNKRKIADRLVDVQFSSQTELMQAMFPKAKCVTWKGQVPVIGRPEYEYSAGFQGFLSSEEMTMTVKFASEPRKSRYSGKHIQRPYESMISCLFKFPFHATTTYTLGERDLLFSTTLKMLVALVDQIRRNISDVLTVTLLDELVQAALQVPAFSEWQRAQLVDTVRGMTTVRVELDALAASWPFEVIARKPYASDEHVNYYANLLRQATMPQSLAERSAAQGVWTAKLSCFGYINVPWPANKMQLTFAEAAKIEWDYLEMVLKKNIWHNDVNRR